MKMFDIAKAVEKTKKARDKKLKLTIKKIEQQIKQQINNGMTYVWISLWHDEEETTRIIKYFENKGYMVSNDKFGNDVDIRISWDYVEGSN